MRGSINAINGTWKRAAVAAVYVPMPLIPALVPLVDLAHLAALLGIRTWDRDDAADLDELAALLARRTALAQQRGPGPAPFVPPPLRVVK